MSQVHLHSRKIWNGSAQRLVNTFAKQQAVGLRLAQALFNLIDNHWHSISKHAEQHLCMTFAKNVSGSTDFSLLLMMMECFTSLRL